MEYSKILNIKPDWSEYKLTELKPISDEVNTVEHTVSYWNNRLEFASWSSQTKN